LKQRKTIQCIKCQKEKKHFGKGMCSACLRNTKRQTMPHFYLQTCYSELSRRVKTFDPLRPNYYGLNKCTKSEFLNKFLTDSEFLRLYKNWQISGYKRRHSPSIDRINNSLGYTLDNIRFILHTENSGKDDRLPIEFYNGLNWLKFDSQKQLSNYLNLSASAVCKALKKGKILGFPVRRSL